MSAQSEAVHAERIVENWIDELSPELLALATSGSWLEFSRRIRDEIRSINIQEASRIASAFREYFSR